MAQRSDLADQEKRVDGIEASFGVFALDSKIDIT